MRSVFVKPPFDAAAALHDRNVFNQLKARQVVEQPRRQKARADERRQSFREMLEAGRGDRG